MNEANKAGDQLAEMQQMLVTAIRRAGREETAQVTEMQRQLGAAIVDAINEPAWRALFEQMFQPLFALVNVPPSGLLAEAIRDAERGPGAALEAINKVFSLGVADKPEGVHCG